MIAAAQENYHFNHRNSQSINVRDARAACQYWCVARGQRFRRAISRILGLSEYI
jgi:hypothetical protein